MPFLIRIDIEGIKCFGSGNHGECHCFPVHWLPDVDRKCELVVPVYGMRDIPERAAGIGQQVAAADALDVDIGASPILACHVTDRPGEVH